MEVGVSLDMLQQERRSDASVMQNHLIGEFSFGGMPPERAERNPHLFAEKALPTLKHDPSFCLPITPAGELDTLESGHENVFAQA